MTQKRFFVVFEGLSFGEKQNFDKKIVDISFKNREKATIPDKR